MVTRQCYLSTYVTLYDIEYNLLQIQFTRLYKVEHDLRLNVCNTQMNYRFRTAVVTCTVCDCDRMVISSGYTLCTVCGSCGAPLP